MVRRTLVATALVATLVMSFPGLWGVPSVFSEALAAPLAASITPPSGLTHWWPGDGNANDIKGTADGTLQSGATSASGKVLQGFSFDGSGAIVTFGANVGNFGTSDFTVGFWMKTGSTNQMGVLGKRPTCDNGSFWDVRLIPAGAVGIEVDDGASGYTGLNSTQDNLHDNRFHHVAVVRQGSTLPIYVDGNPAGSTPTVGVTNITNPVDLAAGRSACSGVGARSRRTTPPTPSASSSFRSTTAPSSTPPGPGSRSRSSGASRRRAGRRCRTRLASSA